MTTLITGVTGAVGSRYARRASGRIRVLVRDEERAGPWWNRGAEVVVGDLRDPDAVKRAVAGVDAVVHLAAAFRGVPDEECVAVSRDAATELGRAALAAGVSRFVFASTNLVYGRSRGRPALEDDEPRPDPDHTYPVCKAAAERELLRLPEEGLPVRVVRLAFVYGEGDPHLAWVRGLARNWPAHQRLQMIHHADVAQALDLALAADGVDGRIYNAADDAPVTAWEVLRLGGETMTEEASERLLDDPWLGIVDTSRIRAELGYRPTYPTIYQAHESGAL